VPQGLHPLLNLEMPEIFLHNVRHGHAKRSREILHRQVALFLRVVQKLKQTFCKSFGVARGIKIYRQLFALCHLAKVWDICANDWHTKRAREMRHTAAASRRRVRHHRHTGSLEQIGQIIFLNVAAELDSGISGILLFHRLDISCSLRMIAATDDQAHIWHL
jgi:hypothetical protein